MADASSPPAYALRTPAAARGESITSVLQREILGDAATPTAAAPDADETDTLPEAQTTEPEIPRTPPPTATEDHELVAIATPEALSQPTSQQLPAEEKEEERRSSADRRRTLSPSKALAFFNQEGIADAVVAPSRRDTVSPDAIRRLLHGIDHAGGDAADRRASVAPTLVGLAPTGDAVDDAVLSDFAQDVERTKQFLESSKMALRDTTPTRKSKRIRESTPSKPTTTTTTNDQDSFTDAFFSATLLSRDDRDDENNTIESIDDTVENRRATLEPMDAHSMLAELRAEMGETAADDEDEEKKQEASQASMTTRRTRQSPSPSPNTRSRKRRATIDPVDLATIRDGPAPGSVVAGVKANRRDTIGDGDLQVLRREFGLEATSTDSRKRKSKSPPPPKQPDSASKRTRFHDASTVTPEKSKGVGTLGAETLISPPPTNRTNKTPLKSCLSARKAKKNDQTTPSKSVNFGPSQGAEFNKSSPSTSMTPMPARDARVQFPLLEKSPPASDDDEETSLNTSLLDEADNQEISGDENDAASIELSIDQSQLRTDLSVSTRTRRRYSLRGVSPLDNQANARRQRRLSAMSSSTQQQSPLVSARNRRAFEAAATAAAVARGSGPVKTSFMSASGPAPQNRIAYADSSASSDEGEDMEITGDFTNHAATAATLHTGIRRSRLSESPQRSIRSARQDSLFVDSPLSDTTVEIGSLQQLLVESEKDEEQKQGAPAKRAEHDDDEIVMDTLTDLAREAEDEEPQRSVSNVSGQDKNLQPIAEADDEDRRSSSAHSQMSLDSDEESDDEYDKKRKSLVVNLSSKFERFGSGTPKNRKQAQKEQPGSSLKRRLSALVSPAKRYSPARAAQTTSPVRLPEAMRIDEVLARVELNDVSWEPIDIVNVAALDTDVQRSTLANASLGNLRFSINEITSWCGGLGDSIPALGREKVSRFFSTEDPATLSQINESIQMLRNIENVHVRGGYCQWRSKVEKTICDGLVQCENKLAMDLKTLRSMQENDRSYRENELHDIKELMERERQMEQLLDGIEEQQTVQREYETSVQSLESECSSLSLEASVLDQQFASLEQASPQVDLSAVTEAKLRQDVLELEELLAVRESVGMWRVLSATGSSLAIASRYDDVFFGIDVRVSIDAGSPNKHAKLKISPVFTTKTHRIKDDGQSQFEESDDALSTIAPLILSKTHVERFESNAIGVSELPRHLGALSTALRRAYQYLSDLRSISTQFGMSLVEVEDKHYLWIDFVRFPHVAPGGKVVDGVKFSVGHVLQSSWPYTNYEWRAQVSYGTVTEEKLRQQLDEVSTRSSHDYLSRVCQRLRDVFIQEP